MARLAACSLCLAALVVALGGCPRQQALSVYPAAEGRDEAVLLVHGLARSGRSMVPLAHHLRSQGYLVVVLDYPSTTAPVAELCARHLQPALAWCRAQGVERIHIVTHSLGGIMVRHQVASGGIPDLGRVVMLAPPNRGSEIVDRIGHWRLFGWINGPAGRQLGTGAEDLPARLPPVDFPCGVIAGHASINWINSGLLIPGPDDGKVAVARAGVEGMDDSLVLPVTHPLIMRDRRAWRAIDDFLAGGRFDPASGPGIAAWLAAR